MVDKAELKYKFDKTKHGAAKFTTERPHIVWGSCLAVLVGVSVTENVLTGKVDNLTTENTAAVQQELRQEFAALAAKPDDQEAQREFLYNLFRAEDLSERQTQDKLREFEKNYQSHHDVLGYKIGHIGDLRESRAEVGTEDIKALADHNRPKSTDEKIAGRISNVILFSLWALMIFNVRDRMRVAAKNKPRNPKYKH
ncbi:MAG: hypothetical protein EA357_08670 [Micavibrio sp.]|nr:MAG: hypothetical protein EA357_08670 [Micavibrio sp.]